VSTPNSIVWNVAVFTRVLRITTANLPAGIHGHAYSATLTATGGTPSYKWSIAKGSKKLPNGLHLNLTTGHVSGTPKVRASVTVTFQVKDSRNPTPRTATKPLRIAIS
jgi:hypothetical protein